MTDDNKMFINSIAEACIKLYDKYKILPSLTIAQAIKESAWGKSKLSSLHYNFFGMKWNSKCKCNFVEYNTKEWNGKEYITIKAKFRSYNSFLEGIQGYYDFITSYKRYSNLIGELDSKTACIKIQKDGWATSPTYADSLYNDYIIKYDLIKFDDIVLGRTKEAVEKTVIEKKNIYIVKKGDSLWNISAKIFGNGIYWRRLYDYNNLKSTLIKEGQILELPM